MQNSLTKFPFPELALFQMWSMLTCILPIAPMATSGGIITGFAYVPPIWQRHHRQLDHVTKDAKVHISISYKGLDPLSDEPLTQIFTTNYLLC